MASPRGYATPSAEEKERSFDFGVQMVGGEVKHSFFLTNTGKQALAVGKITTNCSCTKVVSQPKSIAAGERGEIVVVTRPEKAGISNITIMAETKRESGSPSSTKEAAAFAVFRLTGVVMANPSEPKTSEPKPVVPVENKIVTPAPALPRPVVASTPGTQPASATNAAPAIKAPPAPTTASATTVPAASVPTLSAADFAALSISANEMLTVVKSAAPGSSDLVLVDLRSPELFGKARMKGSVNMTPLGLMARHDYKDKALVVVIDDGMGTLALPARLQRLKLAGWKNVRLLQGGLRSWQLAGGALEGTAPQGSALATVSPAAFYERQHADEAWLVLTVGALTFPTRFPVIAITEPVGTLAFTARLQQEIKAHLEVKKILVATSDTAVAAISKAGSGITMSLAPADQLEVALRPLGLPLYYMEGGAGAFTTFSQQQTRFLQAREVTLGNQASTHTSEQSRGPVVRGAGCGTCSK